MTTVLEDLAMAEDLLLSEQSETTWGALHFIRHARETLLQNGLRDLSAPETKKEPQW